MHRFDDCIDEPTGNSVERIELTEEIGGKKVDNDTKPHLKFKIGHEGKTSQQCVPLPCPL